MELENFAASLGSLLQEKSSEGKINVLPSQIFLWRRQALALRRSEQHLNKIDRFVDIAKDIFSDGVQLSIQDCGVMLLDQKEFTDLAFSLISDGKIKE